MSGSYPDQLPSVSVRMSKRRSASNSTLNIRRMSYNISKFNENFNPIANSSIEVLKKLKPDFSMRTWIRRIISLFPISIWLPQYDFKECLLSDILVGITIAIFQVPQSMGYCLIAHVPAVNDLYSSFFPALFYAILGTGKHCAFGPFAIVSGVMTGNIVLQVMEQLGKQSDNTVIQITDPLPTIDSITDNFNRLKNIDIAIMVAIIIGIYILVFGTYFCLQNNY